jgi:hypothetical protein
MRGFCTVFPCSLIDHVAQTVDIATFTCHHGMAFIADVCNAPHDVVWHVFVAAASSLLLARRLPTILARCVLCCLHLWRTGVLHSRSRRRRLAQSAFCGACTPSILGMTRLPAYCLSCWCFCSTVTDFSAFPFLFRCAGCGRCCLGAAVSMAIARLVARWSLAVARTAFPRFPLVVRGAGAEPVDDSSHQGKGGFGDLLVGDLCGL